MKKLSLSYNFKKERVVFIIETSYGRRKKVIKLTKKELWKMCITIQNRITFKHLGTVFPHYFGFSYSSDF